MRIESSQPPPPEPVTFEIISVRGWSAEADPNYLLFLARLRERGFIVHDIYVPGDDMPDFQAWVSAVISEINRCAPTPLERNLLGYCLGGHLLLGVVAALIARRECPRYLGLIDVRDLSPLAQLNWGIYGDFRVPWRRRVRHHARLLAGPLPLPGWGAVLRAWGRALRKTAARWARLRQHGVKTDGAWRQLHLAYGETWPALHRPVFVYTTSHFIAENDGDPTLGLAPVFRSGYALRTFEGHHSDMLIGADGSALLTRIAEDLAEPGFVWRHHPAQNVSDNAGDRARMQDDPDAPRP
jgi:thioesterase domain-containing protein